MSVFSWSAERAFLCASVCAAFDLCVLVIVYVSQGLSVWCKCLFVCDSTLS